jgi:hypothetical protein
MAKKRGSMVGGVAEVGTVLINKQSSRRLPTPAFCCSRRQKKRQNVLKTKRAGAS